MKKALTKKQLNEVCDLIDIMVSHLSDTDNEYNSVHYSIGRYGRSIELLTELIKDGYDELYPFDGLISIYRDIKISKDVAKWKRDLVSWKK